MPEASSAVSSNGDSSRSVNPARCRTFQNRLPGRGEVVPHCGGVQPGIDAAEEHAQSRGDHVRNSPARSRRQLGPRGPEGRGHHTRVLDHLRPFLAAPARRCTPLAVVVADESPGDTLGAGAQAAAAQGRPTRSRRLRPSDCQDGTRICDEDHCHRARRRLRRHGGRRRALRPVAVPGVLRVVVRLPGQQRRRLRRVQARLPLHLAPPPGPLRPEAARPQRGEVDNRAAAGLPDRRVADGADRHRVPLVRPDSKRRAARARRPRA